MEERKCPGTCDEKKQTCIPFFVAENQVMHMDATNKRMLMALLAVCITFILTIVVFVADMQRGFDTQNLQAQTRDILGAVTSGTAQTIAASTQNAANAITAIKDGNAALIREFGNVETALTALGGKQQECCCEILRAVDGVNYNGAINTAAINANTTAQTQKILDAIMGNRMADMQSQINALQLQAATANVLRFPNAWTYAGGVFPPVTTPAAVVA